MAKGLKTGGREKGTQNKLSVTIRETLAEVLSEYNNDTLRSDLNELKPAERIKAITNLYRLLLPPIKPEAPEDNQDITPLIVHIKRMDGSSD